MKVQRTGLKQSKLLLLACCILMATASAVQAGQQAASGDAAAADAAYAAKDWAKAAPLYERLAETAPATPRNWYRLGMARQALGEHEQALRAFEKARDAGAPRAIALYNIACVRATMGQVDAAFRDLADAVKQGFNQPEQMAGDDDLVTLRSDARFAPLVEEAKRNQAPCKYTAEFRQFDFWVGEWNVIATQGQAPAGESRIELILGDCVVLENWKSIGSPGYAGKSYNTYNASLKRWEQFWVDNSAGTIHFHGSLKDGVMDYWTDDLPQPDGTVLRRHLQFFRQDANHVRQFSQGSKDGGKTWFVEYDLTYNRKT